MMQLHSISKGRPESAGSICKHVSKIVDRSNALAFASLHPFDGLPFQFCIRCWSSVRHPSQIRSDTKHLRQNLVP